MHTYMTLAVFANEHCDTCVTAPLHEYTALPALEHEHAAAAALINTSTAHNTPLPCCASVATMTDAIARSMACVSEEGVKTADLAVSSSQLHPGTARPPEPV